MAVAAGSTQVQAAGPSDGRRVAIVHDYLTQHGGAERVVLTLHAAFPDATIYTSLFDPDGTFPEFSRLCVQTSRLNRVAPLRHHHRIALPLLAPSFSRTEVTADVVICSSSGWAHGVRAHGRKVVYCYAPAHWLYETDAYLAGRCRAARVAMSVLGPALRRWDQSAARTADVYVTSSSHTQRAIRDVYGLDAEVVPPPCSIEPDGEAQALAGMEPGYLLCVSRLTAYKHIDALLAALELLPSERLVVVGAGPEAARLHYLAPRNVVFLERVGDDELRWLYAHARAVIAASFEDFGLTPVEGAMFGTPALVLRYGGYLETVVDEVTGLFFDQPTPTAIANAVGRLNAAHLDSATIRRHARKFGVQRFTDRIRALALDGSEWAVAQ